MWERGRITNPGDPAFALNNLNAHNDIRCPANERQWLYQLLVPAEAAQPVPFVVADNMAMVP